MQVIAGCELGIAGLVQGSLVLSNYIKAGHLESFSFVDLLARCRLKWKGTLRVSPSGTSCSRLPLRIAGPSSFERSVAARQAAWLLGQLRPNQLRSLRVFATPLLLCASTDPAISVKSQLLWGIHRLVTGAV
jgi:hypothetical protein